MFDFSDSQYNTLSHWVKQEGLTLEHRVFTNTKRQILHSVPLTNYVPKWGRAVKGEDNEINLAWLASVLRSALFWATPLSLPHSLPTAPPTHPTAEGRAGLNTHTVTMQGNVIGSQTTHFWPIKARGHCSVFVPERVWLPIQSMFYLNWSKAGTYTMAEMSCSLILDSDITIVVLFK